MPPVAAYVTSDMYTELPPVSELALFSEQKVIQRFELIYWCMWIVCLRFAPIRHFLVQGLQPHESLMPSFRLIDMFYRFAELSLVQVALQILAHLDRYLEIL